MTLRVFIANNSTAKVTDNQYYPDLIDQSDQQPEFNTLNWRDINHFDSEDDYRTGC